MRKISPKDKEIQKLIEVVATGREAYRKLISKFSDHVERCDGRPMIANDIPQLRAKPEMISCEDLKGLPVGLAEGKLLLGGNWFEAKEFLCGLQELCRSDYVSVYSTTGFDLEACRSGLWVRGGSSDLELSWEDADKLLTFLEKYVKWKI